MAIALSFGPLPGVIRARLRSRGAALRVALCLLILAAGALAHVHLRLQVLDAGYALSRETRLHHELEDQNQKLRIERQMRCDPALIEKRARAELHMASPDPGAIRTLRLPAAARTRGGP